MIAEILGIVGAVLYCASAGLHLYSPASSFAVFMGANFVVGIAMFNFIIGN